MDEWEWLEKFHRNAIVAGMSCNDDEVVKMSMKLHILWNLDLYTIQAVFNQMSSKKMFE